MKILVVDDHPLILEALHHTLLQLDQDALLHDARTAAEGRALANAHPDADLLLLDLGLPHAHGLSLLLEVREHHPAIPVVVLSGSERHEDVMRAIDAGAMGYIPKSYPPKLMLSALRVVLSGAVYLPPLALQGPELASSKPPTRTPVEEPATLSVRSLGLTERQAQVLALILQGKPNKLICRELDLAEGTVKVHVAAVLRALNVQTRTQGVVAVSRLGLRLDDLVSKEARP